ncbi:MAG TPA: hypothetical protein VKR53_00870 [Puia sp.]|nr:hypothetical protein [Puia sp.]
MKKSNIDTIFLYAIQGAGEIILISDSCYTDEDQYLFYMKSDRCFLKRFDNCKIYPAVLLDSNPFLFYFRNKIIIDKDEIKPPTYFTTKKGKRFKVISSTDHTCFYEMVIFLKEKKVFKKTNDYDLNTKMADAGKRNIYYYRNRKTKFYEFLNQLDAVINRLKTSNKILQE